MDEFNAFQEGIKYGGLRNKSEIRVLICYILSAVGEPMSKQQLADCLTETELVNYFEISEAADAIVASSAASLVDYNDVKCLEITPAGREIAKTLESELTRSVKEKAVSAAMHRLSRARTERENTVTIEKRGSGYFVTFVMYGFSEEIMRLTLYAADSMQAHALREGFLENPADFYSSVIEKLI